MLAAPEVRPPSPSASAVPASEAGGGLGGRGRLSGSSKLSESRPAARWGSFVITITIAILLVSENKAPMRDLVQKPCIVIR